MVGLIWMVQIVHYPLFRDVGNNQFAKYEQLHSSRITPIVGIPMAIELLTAIALCYSAPSSQPKWLAWAGLALLVGIWFSTACLQVPCHQKLSSGFDANAYRFLVVSNWLRTSLWTARGGTMAYAMWLVVTDQKRM
jgi:hypothetical protein